MTTRKNQNSILVLATLGVYLGLVLVGATPQILAQAAMTKQFNVKDEIEVKDDLDKKPDDCSENLSERAKQLLNLDVVSEGVISFVGDLDQLFKIGKIAKDEQFDFDFTRKVAGGGVETSYPSFTHNRWAQMAAADNVEGIISLICPWNGCEYFRKDPESGFDVSVTNVSYVLDSNDLVIKITTEQKDSEEAGKLAAIYEEAFRIGACSTVYSEPAERIVYKNTKAAFSQSQVFIVTRLPRAGLDSLLAANAK